jgi:hypothetical protein
MLPPAKKAITHPAILSGSRAWYLFNDDFLWGYGWVRSGFQGAYGLDL